MPHFLMVPDRLLLYLSHLDQGWKLRKIFLVLVPIFSASPQNALVLVPYISARALSTKVSLKHLF